MLTLKKESKAMAKKQSTPTLQLLRGLLSEKFILVVLLVLLATGVTVLVFKETKTTKLAEPFTIEQEASE